MPITPHSSEWFERLLQLNPMQAGMTARMIELAGTEECCGICGDTENVRDYKLVSDPSNTVRFCDTCKMAQQQMHGLSVDPI